MPLKVFTLISLLFVSYSSYGQENRTPKPMDIGIEGEGSVFVVPVDGMIDNALAKYLDRAVDDAVAAGGAAIVFQVDTFGGLVDAADEIRTTILDSPIPTIAFINKNAASAGALISYANDRIVMAPGSSIGAATVVDGVGGQAAPDKYQSYMRSQMRATAEANGRDPAVAAAMVDPDLVVPGVSEEGKVLTLSSEEALKLGVADAIISNLDDVILSANLDGREIVTHSATRTEKVLRFFVSPVIQSILMLMMMGGLYFELQSPGVGFPGMMALIGASLFFAPHYANGLVESWEIILFVLGAGLIAVEIFIIPGFGFAGVSGIICVIAALLFGLVGNVGFSFPSVQGMSTAITTLAATLILFVMLLFSLGRYLPKSERFNKLVLQPELGSTSGYLASPAHDSIIGRTGVAITPLRPAGTAEIDGERIDVVSRGEFVPAGSSVKVLSAKGSKIEVRVSDPETSAT
ncbi:MAG: nodulation protein NfeD [Rhodothermales bacterium]|nr:nodulation protein NfeD [Rhodothermales bacterium]